MNSLNRFLKQNKKQRPNESYAATKSLVDEKGKPLLWTLRPLTTVESERLREECMTEVPTKDKNGRPKAGSFSYKLDTSKYLVKLASFSVIEPNLMDKDLQDSYGVMTPEALITEMIDNPAEYNELIAFVQKMNGFDATLDDKVEEAKN